MTTTATCPVCAQTFPYTPHQRPRRRYCSDRCRKTAWQRRRTTNQHPPGGGAIPRPSDVIDAVSARSHPPARCPHCARPITVVTLLVTPTAAQVSTPGAHYGR
jgi:hypothetical protein